MALSPECCNVNCIPPLCLLTFWNSAFLACCCYFYSQYHWPLFQMQVWTVSTMQAREAIIGQMKNNFSRRVFLVGGAHTKFIGKVLSSSSFTFPAHSSRVSVFFLPSPNCFIHAPILESLHFSGTPRLHSQKAPRLRQEDQPHLHRALVRSNLQDAGTSWVSAFHLLIFFFSLCSL